MWKVKYFLLFCCVSNALCGPPPCSPGWYPFGSSCYMMAHNEMNWSDAKQVNLIITILSCCMTINKK